MNDSVIYLNNTVFKNSINGSMCFNDVFNNMLNFIDKKKNCSYVLSIGTDSQVTNVTTFISAICLKRITPSGLGNGAWACLKKYVVPRRITSLREKISTETNLSLEIAYMFNDERLLEIIDMLSGYGGDFKYEIHLDIGKNGPTKTLINETCSRIIGMGLDYKIKPDSYTASSYANRYTKIKHSKNI